MLFDGIGTFGRIWRVAALALVAAYVVFMRKYYHLHEEYLASLKR